MWNDRLVDGNEALRQRRTGGSGMSAMSDLARLSRLAPGDSRGTYVRASADDVPADEDVERKRDDSKSPHGIGGSYPPSYGIRHPVRWV